MWVKIKFILRSEASKWWKNLDGDTKLNATWVVFDELFSNKWIMGTKMEAMHEI
jgi:hypothetical protein